MIHCGQYRRLYSIQYFAGRTRCAVDQQFDDFRRYSIERPNKSVALIVMNIRTPPLAATSTVLPLRLWRRKHCVGIVSVVEFDRDVRCAARLTLLCTHQQRHKDCSAVFDKDASKTSICNASMSHGPTTLIWILTGRVVSSVICKRSINRLDNYVTTYYASDLHREGHYKMMGGVCPSSLCLSVACLYPINTVTDNPPYAGRGITIFLKLAYSLFIALTTDKYITAIRNVVCNIVGYCHML